MRSACPPTHVALTLGDADDRRLSSVSAAIDWAKMNNLLGIFLDADLLVRIFASLSPRFGPRCSR